ncbi:MAG: J domain-containing protein [Planctomycetota bacterium]|jgi:curved DNA-binding protein CbpA
MADFYELLGVTKAASAAEVRKAYALQARKKHPDRFPEGPEKDAASKYLQEITTAFNTLSNEKSRAEYDQQRERPQPTTPEEIARDAFERSGPLLEAGQLDEAVTLLRTAVHHFPESAEYHAALGRALAQATVGAREAIEVLEKATKLAPRDAGLFADLALLMHRQGLRVRARRMLETARGLGPSNVRVARAASEIGSE